MTSHKIALLYGTFHHSLINTMLDEARTIAQKLELEIIKEVGVPGSFEKPLALKMLLQEQHINGVAVLGIIERGETKHGLVMAQAVFQAVIELELQFMKPVGMGIIGPEIFPSQIDIRLRPAAAAAVNAVARMLKVLNATS